MYVLHVRIHVHTVMYTCLLVAELQLMVRIQGTLEVLAGQMVMVEEQSVAAQRVTTYMSVQIQIKYDTASKKQVHTHVQYTLHAVHVCICIHDHV